MPTPLKEPTLFALYVRGVPVAAIAAKSRAEADRYIERELVSVARVNPLQAHLLGLGGLAVEYALPEYDPGHTTGAEGEQLVQLPAGGGDAEAAPDERQFGHERRAPLADLE